MNRLFCLVLLLMGPSCRGQVVSGPAGSYTNTNTQVLTVPGPIALPSPWSGVPGVYTIAVPGPVIVTSTACSTTFTWSDGPGPTPPPVPPPPPPPPPAPVETAHLWVIAVYDLDVISTLQPGQIALHTSTTVKPALKALDAEWLEYATKNPESARFAALLTDIPGVIVLKKGPDGKGVKVGDPFKIVDEASVVAAISKIRGK